MKKNTTSIFIVHLIQAKQHSYVFCGLYETVNVIYFDEDIWKGYNTYGFDDLKILNNLENFANSLIIFGDLGDKLRILDIDTLNSKGRHQSIDKICVRHTVTDLNTKARENTPTVNITSNSSQLFFNRVQNKFNFNAKF